MLLFTFQGSIISLIILSFLMVLAVPVIFASPTEWDNKKKIFTIISSLWIILIFLVGILSNFVI